MTITLSPTLTTEMNSLTRHPASGATAERFLPEWTAVVSGLSGGKTEQFAHGHAACVAVNGNGAGEDILFRARCGSYATPQDGTLYTAVIKGADLAASPTTWESKWVSSGLSGLFYPAWYNNNTLDPASFGASMAAVWSGTFFRVFYVLTNGFLYYTDFDTAGAALTSYMPIGNLTITSFQKGTMQLASCRYNEVFVLRTELIEDSLDVTWHKPVYGSRIHMFSGNLGAWTDWPPFPYTYQADAALIRDGQFKYGSATFEWGGGSATDVTAQWGKRPCGGLAVNNLDAGTVAVSAGYTFWKRFGYNTHNQGIITYIYHRDSGQWERGVEVDMSDYVVERLDYALFARGSNIEGNNILVWSRNVEPSDYNQVETSLALPRVREVVYARFDATGKALTQHQYLGSQDDLTAAAIVAVTHAGVKWLYAIGWRSVSQSPPASFLCSLTASNVGIYCDSYKTSVSNRSTMAIDLSVADAGSLFIADSPLKAGRLVRIYSGIPAEQIQIAQGLIDTLAPNMNLITETHQAKLVARAEKGLLDPRSEELIEVLPQNTVHIVPADPISHIANHKGYWELTKMEWPTKFAGFAANFAYLKDVLSYRLRSFPYANTGGDQGAGYPGMVLDQRQQHKGTWFNDAAWTDLSPMVDGAIEASVRFGDVNNAASPLLFYARTGKQVSGVVARPDTLITTIHWTEVATGIVFDDHVQQTACMAGLICDAAEMNKKYSFVWEASTYAPLNYDALNSVPPAWIGRPRPFSGSSHTDDTWRAESMDRCDFYGFPTGPNKLYLILSDYDDTDKNWQTNKKWIHKVVAGGIDATGLVPGYPADLKMIVQGGTIFCFYRMHQAAGVAPTFILSAPNQWKFAFSYKAGRFGAGRFGIVGRGHAGIQWDDLYYQDSTPHLTGRSIIPKYDNYVDFWDVKASDCVLDRPMEEVLSRRAWQGFTPTVFTGLVNEPAPPVVNASTIRSYSPAAVENLTIDFRVTLSAAGGEAGVICRAADGITLIGQQHIRMGLVINNTGLPAASTNVTSYLVKRAYDGAGAEIPGAREYSPAVMTINNAWPIPVRITVRGNVYTMWIAGNYVGHFVDSTAGGVYFGLYSVGANATFTQVYVPELYEVSENSTLEVSQTLFDSIKNTIGKRAIKGVFQPSGALKLSYFDVHDIGPTLQDSLIQSAIRLSDRFISIVRVDGAYTWAIYASEILMKFGRRFVQASFPDIFHREFCYREARNLCIRSAEDQVQNTFVGLPDLRVQPEDKVEIFVTQQGLAGHYLVDDVTQEFRMDDEDPQADTTISTRQYVVI